VTRGVSVVAVSLLSIAGLGGGATGAAAAGTHAYHRLSVRRSGISCDILVANSINNHGTILGTVYCGDAAGFIKRAGKVHQFAVPGPSGTDTLPAGIADDGAVVLSTERNYELPVTGYVRSPSGHLRKLSDPRAGRNGTDPEGINSKGEIVGVYYVGRSKTRVKPFVYSQGKFHKFVLGVKHAKNVEPIDVNNRGDIVGSFIRHGSMHGFVDRHGHVRVVNAPGAGAGKGEGTAVLGISDNAKYWCGVAVFATGDEYQDTSRGFIHHAGRYITTKVPSAWGHTTVTGDIDNAGRAVGEFIASSNVGWQREGFVAQA
jgi:hypothetical protein